MFRLHPTITSGLVLVLVASLARLHAEEFLTGDGPWDAPVEIAEPEVLFQDGEHWLTNFELQPPQPGVESPQAVTPIPPPATRPSLLSRLRTRPARASAGGRSGQRAFHDR